MIRGGVFLRENTGSGVENAVPCAILNIKNITRTDTEEQKNVQTSESFYDRQCETL